MIKIILYTDCANRCLLLYDGTLVEGRYYEDKNAESKVYIQEKRQRSSCTNSAVEIDVDALNNVELVNTLLKSLTGGKIEFRLLESDSIIIRSGKDTFFSHVDDAKIYEDIISLTVKKPNGRLVTYINEDDTSLAKMVEALTKGKEFRV